MHAPTEKIAFYKFNLTHSVKVFEGVRLKKFSHFCSTTIKQFVSFVQHIFEMFVNICCKCTLLFVDNCDIIPVLTVEAFRTAGN